MTDKRRVSFTTTEDFWVTLRADAIKSGQTVDEYMSSSLNLGAWAREILRDGKQLASIKDGVVHTAFDLHGLIRP